MRVAIGTDDSVNLIKCIHFQLHPYKNMLIKICYMRQIIWIVYELPNLIFCKIIFLVHRNEGHSGVQLV